MGDSDPRIGGGRDVALTVVTASDTKFFPHLRNLLASLGRQTAPAESIVVVDVGLDDAQRAQLAAAGCRIAVYGGELFGDVRRDLAALEVRACLDLLLPDGYGLAVAPKLHTAGGEPTPVLVFSAGEPDPAQWQAIAGTLSKASATGKDLLRTVGSLLDYIEQVRAAA